jgi:hypothetical protein
VHAFSWKKNTEKWGGVYLYLHSHLIFGKIYICNKLSRIITSANVKHNNTFLAFCLMLTCLTIQQNYITFICNKEFKFLMYELNYSFQFCYLERSSHMVLLIRATILGSEIWTKYINTTAKKKRLSLIEYIQLWWGQEIHNIWQCHGFEQDPELEEWNSTHDLIQKLSTVTKHQVD